MSIKNLLKFRYISKGFQKEFNRAIEKNNLEKCKFLYNICDGELYISAIEAPIITSVFYKSNEITKWLLEVAKQNDVLNTRRNLVEAITYTDLGDKEMFDLLFNNIDEDCLRFTSDIGNFNNILFRLYEKLIERGENYFLAFLKKFPTYQTKKMVEFAIIKGIIYGNLNICNWAMEVNAKEKYNIEIEQLNLKFNIFRKLDGVFWGVNHGIKLSDHNLCDVLIRASRISASEFEKVLDLLPNNCADICCRFMYRILDIYFYNPNAETYYNLLEKRFPVVFQTDVKKEVIIFGLTHNNTEFIKKLWNSLPEVERVAVLNAIFGNGDKTQLFNTIYIQNLYSIGELSRLYGIEAIQVKLNIILEDYVENGPLNLLNYVWDLFNFITIPNAKAYLEIIIYKCVKNGKKIYHYDKLAWAIKKAKEYNVILKDDIIKSINYICTKNENLLYYTAFLYQKVYNDHNLFDANIISIVKSYVGDRIDVV